MVATIGEAVRRHIENAHDQRAIKGERAAGGLPEHRRKRQKKGESKDYFHLSSFPIAGSYAVAGVLPVIGGMIGFLATDMSFEYLAPVYVGDTITCTVTISEKNEEQRRVVALASFLNQNGLEVLRARFSGFPGQIRLAK